MAASRIVRIHKTFYARIPPEEVKRLHLQPGQAVDVTVRPVGATMQEAVEQLRGKYKGKLPKMPTRRLWDM